MSANRKLTVLPDINKLIGEYQCPGCVGGIDPETCNHFKLETLTSDGKDCIRCEGHVLGTSMLGGPHIALGMPTGFNRTFSNQMLIWIHRTVPTASDWDRFNIPVWANVVDGVLYVRTFAPRINSGWVDVIPGGTLDLVPQATDISKFVDEMD